MPTYEECYWAMLALNALNGLNTKRLLELGIDAERDRPSLKLSIANKVKHSFDSTKIAFGVTPQHWLGPSHDPRTEECQRFRRMSKGILKHIENRRKP